MSRKDLDLLCVPHATSVQPLTPADLRPAPREPWPTPWETELVLALGAKRAREVLGQMRESLRKEQELFEGSLLTAISWAEANLLWGHIGLAPEPEIGHTVSPWFVDIGGEG